MDAEDRHETGASLMLLGFGIWLTDLLVVFFLPSGIQYGRRAIFLVIILAMAAAGLALLIAGYAIRGKTRSE